MRIKRTRWTETHFQSRFWHFAVVAYLLFAEHAGAAITIITTDASSARPLGGVRVIFGNASTPREATTDAEGKCSFEGTLAPGEFITVQKEGWCPLRWDFAASPGGKSDVPRFNMRPAAKIGGIVADPNGKGIAGAQVFINFPQALLGAHVPVEDFPVTTDTSGAWTANFVPVDVEYIHVEPLHPNYVWEKGQPARKELLAGQALLTMEPILALQGIVVDPAHNPVAGATVVRGEEWGIMGMDENNQVTTDANGRFQFPPGKAGKMQVAALSPRFGPVIKDVELPSKSPIELALTTPHVRRIRVTDLEGNPLPNLKVPVTQWRAFNYPPWEFITDAEGRILMTNAPDDEIQMDFLAPHRMGLRFLRVAASDTEWLVQLGPELRLHGKVTDASTGKPIPAFKITPGWPRQTSVGGKASSQGAQWGLPNQVKEFHRGIYDWTFEEHVIAGTEKPFDFLLKVEADGYAPGVSRAFKPTEKDAEFDFQLAAPSYITGTVHFADASLAVGTRIYLLNQIWDLNTMNGKIQDPRNLPFLTTDADGRFKLMDQQDARFLVAWHEKGFATMEFADFLKTNDIALAKWGRVEGTLQRGNRPAGHETVALCFEQERRRPERGNAARPQLFRFRQYETTTDDNGHFVFDTVPPGAAAITRVESIPRPAHYGLPVGEVWAGCRLLVVDVPEGGNLSVKAGGTGRTVIGRILSTNDMAGCMASLTRSLPPIPFPNNLEPAAKNKWAAEWFWSEVAEPYRIWLGIPPQNDLPAFSNPQVHSWAVNVHPDGVFEIPDVPAGKFRLKAYFRPPGEEGGMATQPPNAGSTGNHLTSEFTVPAGNALQELPPLDLGEIGKAGMAADFPMPQPTAHEPVTVAMTTDHAEVAPGGTFQLFVRLRIAEGYHIYAANPKSKAFTGTSVSLTLPTGVEAVSDWVATPATQAPDGEMIYSNSVTYSQSLKLGAAPLDAPISLKGGVSFQACNDQLCWPPKAVPISTTITSH